VVIVLRPRPQRPSAEETLLPAMTRGLLWTAFVLDVIVVVYMIRMGSWLDTASPLLSMITLGGHHQIVLARALAGLLMLGVLAPLTRGFVRVDRVQRVLLPVAGVLSLAALAGVLSLVALGAAALLVIALLFRPRPRTRIDLTQRRR
jgi:hypothetical protein